MRKYFIALICMISAGFAKAQTLDEAIQYIKYERYESAKKILQPLAATNPLANYYLGICELGNDNGNVNAAKAIFQKYPEDAANMAGIGRTMFIENHAPEAMSMLAKVAGKAKKKDYMPYKYAADAINYTEGGDPNVAVEWYKKALEVERTGDVYLALGDVYRKIQGGGGNAMNNYEYAETFAPTKSMANYKMGNLWYAAKNYDSALVKYAKASEYDAKNPLPYNDLANAYNKISKYAKAKENIELYLPLSDNTIDDQIRYANVLYLSKNYNDAISKMKELISKGTEKAYMYRVIGYSQYEIKDYTNALMNMDNFFKKQDPKKIIPLDYFYYGKILLRDSTKKALADEQFLKGIAVDTTADKAPTLRSIAEAFYEAEDYASAAKWYKQLAESNYATKEDRDFWWAGYMSFYSNDLTTAEQMFTKYNQSNPTEPLGILWLARTSEKSKDKDYKNGSASALYTQWLGMVNETDAAKKKDFTKAYTYLAMVAYNTNNKENVKKYADKLLVFNPEDDTAKQLLKALPAMK
jgi:tetratricopeptide (TPR) repeat protein